MKKLLTNIIEPIAGLFCLIMGLILWNNLTLHFAEIEEVLPSLKAGGLLSGKTGFLSLIAIAFTASLWFAIRLPWKALFGGFHRPVRIILSCTLFILTFVPLFWLRFGGAAWIILVMMAMAFFISAVGIIVICKSLSSHIQLPQIKPRQTWRRLHPWFPALLIFLTALYFSFRCFDFIPHVEDAIAQLLQARIYAAGHATAELFYPQEFFFFGFMVDFNRWFSQYPPGHPLMLMLGVLAGAPYLVNPLLGFIGAVLFYYLLKNIADESTARWGVWAMAAAPYIFFMCSGFMNHPTALAASLLGWLGLKKGETGKSGWLLLSGLGFGYCLATRPLEGAIFTLLGGLYLLTNFGFTRTSSWLKMLPYALGFALTALLYPLNCALTTGSPFVTGYELTWGWTGFGLGAVNWGPPHTFGYGMVNTLMSIAGLNVFLYEIPIPALWGVFFWALWGKKLTRWDALFLAAMLLIPIAYLFYYFHDYCFGPRYYYVIAPQLIYFSIKGIQALYTSLVERVKIPAEFVRHGLIWAGILLLVIQVFAAVPRRASVYADSYWGTDDGPMKEARRLGLKNAIVFIETHPWEVLQTKLHSLGFIMGDAHRFLFLINNEGLDEVLQDMGIGSDASWNADVDLEELERRIIAWNRTYLEQDNPPLDPWAEPGHFTYYSNGAVHLDPRDREPSIILARDLGSHNVVLLEKYPQRKIYRYAYDANERRFRILPVFRDL